MFTVYMTTPGLYTLHPAYEVTTPFSDKVLPKCHNVVKGKITNGVFCYLGKPIPPMDGWYVYSKAIGPKNGWFMIQDQELRSCERPKGAPRR